MTVKDNVFFSSFTPPGLGSTGTVVVADLASQVGFAANYNDYFSSNGALSFQWGPALAAQSVAAWQTTSSTPDAQSFSSNPQWFNAAAFAEDFHPLSTAGRWNQNQATPGFVAVDVATSPTIDAGDPLESFNLEASPNGGRVNLGSYGNTLQASESITTATFAGCAVTNRVGAGQPYATISSAVAALPLSLPVGQSCVVIEDGETYLEQVTVQGFAVNASSSIAIFADPATLLTPSVNPPLTSTGAFVIMNASVSIAGINVAPTRAMMYGVSVSSAYVTISSVNVIDPAGLISAAGVLASSWTTVSYASVTVSGPSVAGFLLPGSTMTSVSFSSAVNLGAGYALWLNGASSNTFTVFLASSPAGYAAYLSTGSTFNTISRSSMTGSGPSALYLIAASSNTILQSYMADSTGTVVYLSTGSNGNTISQSTEASGGSGAFALELIGASSNTIIQSYISGVSSGTFLGSGSNFNTISQSSMTSAIAGAYALSLAAVSSNTITLSYVVSPLGAGVYLSTGSNGNTISLSTMTSGAANSFALYLFGASSNTIAQSYVLDAVSTAVYVSSGSNFNTISQSTMTSLGTGAAALELYGASSNTVTLTLGYSATLGRIRARRCSGLKRGSLPGLWETATVTRSNSRAARASTSRCP